MEGEAEQEKGLQEGQHSRSRQATTEIYRDQIRQAVKGHVQKKKKKDFMGYIETFKQ